MRSGIRIGDERKIKNWRFRVSDKLLTLQVLQAENFIKFVFVYSPAKRIFMRSNGCKINVDVTPPIVIEHFCKFHVAKRWWPWRFMLTWNSSHQMFILDMRKQADFSSHFLGGNWTWRDGWWGCSCCRWNCWWWLLHCCRWHHTRFYRFVLIIIITFIIINQRRNYF